VAQENDFVYRKRPASRRVSRKPFGALIWLTVAAIGIAALYGRSFVGSMSCEFCLPARATGVH